MTKLADAALFDLWLTQRNGDAFAELARRHAPVVYDLAARTLGDRTAAEDIVQEALLDLALEPTRRPIEVGVAAWLVRFAICRARNWRSSEKCRARRQWIVGARRAEESMPDDQAERTEEMERALAAAEPDERAVLAMRFLHEWDYDRIAAALETSEGAARVRVHRALSHVRARLGVGGEEQSRVTGRLAGIALFSMPSSRLDSVIDSVLGAASAPVAPVASRIPSALRSAIVAIGVAVLVVGAAGSAVNLSRGSEATNCGHAAETASIAAGDDRVAGANAEIRAPRGDAWRGVPRPENWDGGALARLGRGEREIAAPEAARPGVSATPATPDPDAAPAPRAAAPLVDEPANALRPGQGAAGAANSDPGSSDDERADAFARFVRTQVIESVVEKLAPDELLPRDLERVADATDPAPRRRASARSRAVEPLNVEAQALLDEATALVRGVVEQTVADAPSADRESLERARRTGVRAVKRQVREKSDDGTPRAGPRKAARLARVYAILFDLALSEGAAPGAVRWPDGVDVADALADLIRVLSARPLAAAPRRPDIAADDAVPQDVESRRPEFE